MREVTGAVIAIVLVLCAVFVPVAFLGGIAGQLYQQFAVTVAIAVVISGLVALTLTPALCALLLKPAHSENAVVPAVQRRLRLAHAPLSPRRAAGRCDHRLARAPDLRGDHRYRRAAADARARRLRAARGPGLPDRLGNAARRRDAAAHAGRRHRSAADDRPERRRRARVRRRRLRPHRRRQQDQCRDDLHPAQALGRAQGIRAAGRRDVLAHAGDDSATAWCSPSIRRRSAAWAPPAASRSTCRRAPTPIRASSTRRCRTSSATCASATELTGINTFFRPTVPQLHVEVDREKAISLGVPVKDVFDALQSTMGALYVNDFNKFGRTYRVQMQAEGAVSARSPRTSATSTCARRRRRDDPAEGADHRAEHRRARAARALQRLPRRPSLGNGAAGRQLGRGDRGGRASRRKTLPPGYTIAWTGQAFQEKRTARRVDHRVRVRDRHGVPHPRRALRALAAAVRGGARGAVRGVRRARRRVAARHGERHLLPDRPGRADRARGEERDPDRRVRGAGACRRAWAPPRRRWRPRGCASGRS